MRWLGFLVNDPMDKYHFTTPEKCRTLIDGNFTSLDELLEMIPDSRKNSNDITRLNKARDIDSNLTFAASKVREIMSCDVCNAPC